MFSIQVSKFDYTKGRYAPEKTVAKDIKTYEAAVKRAKRYTVVQDHPSHVLITEEGTSNRTRVPVHGEPTRNFWLLGG
jgi:hypothetical protein